MLRFLPLTLTIALIGCSPLVPQNHLEEVDPIILPDLEEPVELLLLTGLVYNGPPCDGNEIISCELAEVNWQGIEDCSDLILPTGDLLQFTSKMEASRSIDLNGSPMTLTYSGSGGSEAMLTFKKKSIYGRIKLHHDRTFIIESVSSQVVWAEIDDTVWNDNPIDVTASNDTVPIIPKDRMEQYKIQGIADRNSVAEYTVTVYYTSTFRKFTADPETFIEQVIAETNQGYVNSEIPIRVRLHCIAESDIQDGQDSSETLSQFTKSQSSLEKVRKSADAAVLLVNSFSSAGSCGVNWFDTIHTGQTIGTVRKGCALGYYSFGHEIAHGLGLAHDRRVASTSSTDYAFGNIIKQGSYRTIMAYSTAGEKRVNYYSNPKVNYQGYPTGTYENDNARVLTENRFAAAAIGDESETCTAAVSSSSSQTSSSLPSSACKDKYSNCQTVRDSCWHNTIATGCPQTCGKCPGMSPLESTYCYDRYSNCSQLARLGYCRHSTVNSVCKKSCNLC